MVVYGAENWSVRMLIKIDIEDDIAAHDAIFVAGMLIDFNNGFGDREIVNKNRGIKGKVTHKSKAGNIFLTISKVGE